MWHAEGSAPPSGSTPDMGCADMGCAACNLTLAPACTTSSQNPQAPHGCRWLCAVPRASQSALDSKLEPCHPQAPALLRTIRALTFNNSSHVPQALQGRGRDAHAGGQDRGRRVQAHGPPHGAWPPTHSFRLPSLSLLLWKHQHGLAHYGCRAPLHCANTIGSLI